MDAAHLPLNSTLSRLRGQDDSRRVPTVINLWRSSEGLVTHTNAGSPIREGCRLLVSVKAIFALFLDGTVASVSAVRYGRRSWINAEIKTTAIPLQ